MALSSGNPTPKRDYVTISATQNFFPTESPRPSSLVGGTTTSHTPTADPSSIPHRAHRATSRPLTTKEKKEMEEKKEDAKEVTIETPTKITEEKPSPKTRGLEEPRAKQDFFTGKTTGDVIGYKSSTGGIDQKRLQQDIQKQKQKITQSQRLQEQINQIQKDYEKTRKEYEQSFTKEGTLVSGHPLGQDPSVVQDYYKKQLQRYREKMRAKGIEAQRLEHSFYAQQARMEAKAQVTPGLSFSSEEKSKAIQETSPVKKVEDTTLRESFKTPTEEARLGGSVLPQTPPTRQEQLEVNMGTITSPYEKGLANIPKGYYASLDEIIKWSTTEKRKLGQHTSRIEPFFEKTLGETGKIKTRDLLAPIQTTAISKAYDGTEFGEKFTGGTKQAGSFFFGEETLAESISNPAKWTVEWAGSWFYDAPLIVAAVPGIAAMAATETKPFFTHAAMTGVETVKGMAERPYETAYKTALTIAVFHGAKFFVSKSIPVARWGRFKLSSVGRKVTGKFQPTTRFMTRHPNYYTKQMPIVKPLSKVKTHFSWSRTQGLDTSTQGLKEITAAQLSRYGHVRGRTTTIFKDVKLKQGRLTEFYDPSSQTQIRILKTTPTPASAKPLVLSLKTANVFGGTYDKTNMVLGSWRSMFYHTPPLKGGSGSIRDFFGGPTTTVFKESALGNLRGYVDPSLQMTAKGLPSWMHPKLTSKWLSFKDIQSLMQPGKQTLRPGGAFSITGGETLTLGYKAKSAFSTIKQLGIGRRGSTATTVVDPQAITQVKWTPSIPHTTTTTSFTPTTTTTTPIPIGIIDLETRTNQQPTTTSFTPTRTITLEDITEVQTPDFFTTTKPVETQVTKPTTKTKDKPIPPTPLTLTTTIPTTTNIPDTIQPLKPLQLPSLKQPQQTKQKQFMWWLELEIPPLTKPREKEKPLEKEESALGLPKGGRRTGTPPKLSQAFQVIVKTKGKWKTIAAGLPKKRAMAKGIKITGKTAARSFRLIKAGETRLSDIPMITGLQKYRKPKATSKLPAGTYIEKTRYAIDQPGEKKEITFKGIQTIKLRGGMKI